MPANTPVHTPAGFAPAFALGYSDEDGNLVLAKSSAPIPVSAGDRARPGALEGSTAASAIVGPFSPVSQISVMLELAGEWTGTVQLQRSSDGGVTRRNVTMGGAQWGRYTANVCEPVWDESQPDAQLFLDITLDSGTLTYRVSQ